MHDVRTLLTIMALMMSGCSTFLESHQDEVFKAMDEIAEGVCKLKEEDRLPLRQAVKERYGVDTAPLCDHLANKG